MDKTFKIVRATIDSDDKFVSFFSGPHKLIYSTEFYTFPKIGYVFTFSSRDFAVQFLKEQVPLPEIGSLYSIWLCQGTKVEDCSVFQRAISRVDYEIFWEDFAQGVLQKDVRVNFDFAPLGTEWFKNLKLLERIE